MGGLISIEKKEELSHLIQSGDECIRIGEPVDIKTGLSPTLVIEPSQESSFIKEELFGPVLAVVSCESALDAANFVNCQTYGLANGIYSSDLQEQRLFATATNSGIIHVNCWGRDPLGVPFGGTRNSGTGKEKCISSLNHFTNIKPICVKL
jgi:hypothetical protein